MYQKVINKWLFVAPSHKTDKKYDVYDNRTGDYVCSFGQIKKNGIPYEQFRDRIGYYKEYNHYDRERRNRYRNRHKKDAYNVIGTPSYFSTYFLWE
jgi:hypothetical protein